MNQATYESNEAKTLANQIARVERAPLHERREAKADFFGLLTDPAILAQRVGWLFDGNYGFGAMMKARDIAARPKLNRIAGISQLIAALECLCSSDMARKAYMSLTDEQKNAANAAIQTEIDSFLSSPVES